MEEITFYNFYSQIRAFVKQLLKQPIEAKPGSTLKKLGLTKDRLIKILLKRKIIPRKESIKDKTDGIQGDAKYVVKYKPAEKSSTRFEREVHKMYGAYVEKNLPSKKQVNEEGEGGDCCGSDGGGVTDGATSQRRKIYVNEEQMRLFNEMFAIPNLADKILFEENGSMFGDFTYDKPVSDGHKNSNFWKPALKRKDGKGGATSIPKKKM